MDYLFGSCRLFNVALAFSGLALVGCATTPKPSLPAVQAHVTARSDKKVAWPRSESEKEETDRAIAGLLRQEFTVETAVQISLLNNRSLRATFEEIGLSEADLIAASRLHNPSLGVSARWPDRRPRGPNIEFSLVADLLDDLLIPVRKKLARERVEQAERRVAHEVLALAAEVKAAFYAVQAHQQIIARFAAIADVNDASADLAQRQFDAGNISRLDLANQQIAAQSAKLEVTRTNALLRGEREKLNRLLGLASSQTAWKIVGELPKLPAHDPALENLEELASSQRLDLAAARGNVEVASRALELKRKTRFLPASLGLGVDTERETDGSRVTGPTLDLALPLFDQGQAELAQLASELRRATDLYEGLASDAASEVREARDELIAARTTTEFYEKTLLPQRTLILRETLLHYNAMQKSNYELLAAKEQQLSAERESVEALRDYWTALARLQRAVGGRLASGGEVTALPRGILADGAAGRPSRDPKKTQEGEEPGVRRRIAERMQSAESR